LTLTKQHEPMQKPASANGEDMTPQDGDLEPGYLVWLFVDKLSERAHELLTFRPRDLRPFRFATTLSCFDRRWIQVYTIFVLTFIGLAQYASRDKVVEGG